jgi:RNA polymerase sigma-70 factor (ECF subfamily)
VTVCSGVIECEAVGPAADDPVDRDAEAIAAAQQGDKAACRRLFARFQRSVHALVWRMLGSHARRSIVEELVQEAFMRAFRSLPRFDLHGPARFSTWLLSIAMRTAIDELRRPRAPLAELTVMPDDERCRPDARAEQQSLGRAIARAVDGLGPELRATFILRGYHDLTYPEIADALGVDVGTVKSRLHRARRALQHALMEVRHAR